MDETHISVKSRWRYLYQTVDQPKKIAIDRSGVNTAAIEEYGTDNEASIKLGQAKYSNSIVEQDYRAIKRLARSVLGLKSFWSATITLAEIEIMHMIRKDQFQIVSSPAVQSCLLTG